MNCLKHIGNRDMLLSTVVVVLVGFIAILSDMFLRSMFWGRRRNDREGGGQIQAILMVIGIILAILAPIAATLMQLAISRKKGIFSGRFRRAFNPLSRGLGERFGKNCR